MRSFLKYDLKFHVYSCNFQESDLTKSPSVSDQEDQQCAQKCQSQNEQYILESIQV